MPTTGWSMEHGKQGKIPLVCIYCLLITMFDCTTFRPKITHFIESDKWMQGEPLGVYKLLKECSRKHS